MRRWWSNVGGVRPLRLIDILDLVGSVDELRHTPNIFVAVGSELRQADEQLLRSRLAPWNTTRILRRATPGDGTGLLTRQHYNKSAPPTVAGSAAISPAWTYIEAAAIDFAICRAASWFAGWSSSSFSVSVAHYRHIDHGGVSGGGFYYAYCGGTRSHNASITRLDGKIMRLHTCKTKRHTAALRAANNASGASTHDPSTAGGRCRPGSGGSISCGSSDIDETSSSFSVSEAPRPKMDHVGMRDLTAALDAFATEDEARVRELFERFRCRHVYLDVGTNQGVQLRKLFEPAQYPNARATHAVYNRFFGTAPRCGVCAVGIEPNPHHYSRLEHLQSKYRQAGVGVLIFHVAASASDGVAHLALGHRDKKDPFEDLGASAMEAWKGMSKVGNAKALTVPVRSVDLSRIIHLLHMQLVRIHGGSRGESRLIMKLDIEGLEFSVLPALARAQALCVVDAMRVEWHTRFWSKSVLSAAARSRNLSLPREMGAKVVSNLHEAVRTHIRELRGATDCRLELLEADDESYMHDRKPWPEGSLCEGQVSSVVSVPPKAQE